MRVQFWNGLSMKWKSGTTSLRSCQICTTTQVSVISSMRPHSPSTMTTSSRRMGWVVAIWNPANRLATVFCAAKPKMMPTTPAETRMLVPNCCTCLNSISTDASVERGMEKYSVLLMT